MISPELLRRYPLCATLNAEEIKHLALISDEMVPAVGHTLFHAQEPANALYLLLNGTVELWYVVGQHAHGVYHALYLHDINPGELVGLSALVEPYIYQSEARVTAPSTLIHINAVALREQCAQDPRLEVLFLRQIAKAGMARLRDTRVQLLAARG